MLVARIDVGEALAAGEDADLPQCLMIGAFE
jgi:hypothetical protein